MRFFVFSYNRGLFLENCVDSIELCSPGSGITIFDDRSDDFETIRALEKLSGRHRVVSSGDDLGHKHGGLYANMQSALDSVEGDDIICFTQDDTQMVRSLSEEDHRFVEQCFSAWPDLGFIYPAFIQGVSLKKDGSDGFYYDADIGLWFRRDSKKSAGIYYSDISLTTSRRLRDAGWAFEHGEPANQRQARSKFCAMGYMASPFMMPLPNATAYRGRTRTLALRLAEGMRACGFYPYHYMTEEEVRRLAAPSTLPIAEDVLRTTGRDLRKPWIYNPLQGSRMLKHLNRVEVLARRMLG